MSLQSEGGQRTQKALTHSLGSTQCETALGKAEDKVTNDRRGQMPAEASGGGELWTWSSWMMHWKPEPAQGSSALTLPSTCLSQASSLYEAAGNPTAWPFCCLALTLGGSIYLSAYINLNRMKTPGRRKIVIYIFRYPQNF